MDPKNADTTALNEAGQNWLEVVKEHVASLRFGTVDITIHDGRVIQIEKTERLRFPKDNPDTAVAVKGGEIAKAKPNRS